MNPGLLELRILQLLDGELHPDHWPELRQQLAESEEARRIYCGQARLVTELGRIRREQQSIGKPMIPPGQIAEEQRRRQIRAASFAAAALITLAMLVMYLVHVHDHVATARFTASLNSNYSISHSKNMSTPSRDDGSLAPGSSVVLKRGVLELELASGARSVVRGPAAFTITGESAIDLDRGTAWFQVPAPALGFTVATGQLVVTDLGTEFGVISQPQQPQSVHLFKGKVQLRSRIGRMEQETLTGTGAREMSVIGKFDETPIRPDRFFTRLPDELPWLGWRFDEPDPDAWEPVGSFPESENLHAKPRPDRSAVKSITGRFGRALHITGSGGFWQSDWPGIAGNAPRTLAFWIRLPGNREYIHPLVGWGHRYGDDDATCSSFFTFVETIDGKGVAGVSLGGCWIKGSSVIADDRWHHVAVTTSGEVRPDGFPEIRLFIDGRQDEIGEFHNLSVKIDPEKPKIPATDVTHADSKPLTAFAQLFPGEDRGHPFAASLDELRIIEGVLSPAEIQRLFEANEMPKAQIAH